jgi:U4/U6.U5 tri-snRNP-associated protein 1
MESSISLEETNKIRVRLGLKPLVDDGAPIDTKEKEANDNFAANKEQELQAKKKRQSVSAVHMHHPF